MATIQSNETKRYVKGFEWTQDAIDRQTVIFVADKLKSGEGCTCW